MRRKIAPAAPSRLKSTSLAALFALALGLLSWADVQALQSVRRSGNPAPAASLGLASGRAGAEWKLTWDPLAAPLAHASAAELLIDDGDHQNQILLSPAQIRSGSILYAPFTGDVCFRLSAYDSRRRAVSEILRALDPGSFEAAGDSEAGYSERRFLRNPPGTVIVRASTVRGASSSAPLLAARPAGWLSRLWRSGSKLESTEITH
jgi:hypothetical protein